ncbi:MAG: hypothetical protein WBG50_02740 [Desulfomonilaceae bacterium]
MVTVSFGWRRSAVIAAAAGVLFPLLGTIALFAVLYNNIYCGWLIYLVLILSNLFVLLFPATKSHTGSVLSSAKATSLSLIFALTALVALEIAFPWVLPADYAQTKELAKSFVNSPLGKGPAGSVVFSNTDQKRWNASDSSNRRKSRFKVWHAPGKEFVYYGYDPNSRLKYVNAFHWNSKGYFDDDYALPKPPGVHRIVIVGDSYVEAVQVPLSRSFHKLWEAALNDPSFTGPRRKFQVIALGNSGTGQVEHSKVIRDEAMLYNPDTIVLTLYTSDFCRDDPELKTELILAAGGITPGFRRLATHGYLALAFAVRRIDDIRRNKIAISPDLLQWSAEDIPRVEAAWSRTLNQVKASRDFCRARGINFVLVYVGSDLEVKYALDPVRTISQLKAMGGPHKTITWDMSKTIRRVTRYCNEHNILFISLLEPLIDAQKETRRYVFGDHYTMFGHKVVAQVLTKAISFRISPLAAEKPSFVKCVAPRSWSAIAGPAGPVKSARSVSQDSFPLSSLGRAIVTGMRPKNRHGCTIQPAAGTLPTRPAP